MSDETGGAPITVAITRSDRSPGIDIVDPIERRRCQIRTSSPVDPRSVSPELFPFPVETAVAVSASSFDIAATGQVYVRDGAGELIEAFEDGSERRYAAGTHHLECSGLIKVYLRCEDAFTLSMREQNPFIEFADSARVVVGCRSLHTRPAVTVTTTEEPEDIAAAISTFGSAVKSTGPDRSFPTYRGHPPAVTLGPSPSIHAGLRPPMTEVAIEVPPRLDRLFPVATLAYYLGLPVELGERSRIVGGGITYELDGSIGFERTVEQVLKRAFLLDCAVRTEGEYAVNFRLRDELAARLDLPFAALYEASPIDRLAEYLAISYDSIADLLPNWRVSAHIDTDPMRVETLPFLVDDLAALHIAEPRPAADGGHIVPSEGGTRSVGFDTGTYHDATSSHVHDDSMERVWLAGGVPPDATKGVPEAYEHRLGRSPRDGPIEIAVISNDPAMEEETVVDELYGSRAELPFEVTVKRQLSVAALAEILAEDYHFVHYIGHIDDDGFRCHDGRLDARDIPSVGPEAFLLNACHSYRQGVALVRSGAIGGIVTRNEIVNYGAIRIGRTVARLLNLGFPLRPALEIAQKQSVIGGEYTVVGDGTISVVQAPIGLSQLYHLRKTNGSYAISIEGFGAQPGMGCMWIPYVPGNDRHYLASSRTEEFELSETELEDFLALEPVPIRMGDRLLWSNEWPPIYG